jgi:hypothetical protein
MSDANGWSDHLVEVGNGTAPLAFKAAGPFALGNVQLVGMDVKELQQAVDARKQPNRTVTFLPDDIILNTRRAFSVSATGAGFGSAGSADRPIHRSRQTAMDVWRRFRVSVASRI